MENVTDILTLGTIYTVADPKGNILGQIQIIPQSEILDATIGPYDPSLGDFSEYLAKAKQTLTGFDDVDPLKLLWYPTYDDEIALNEIVEYAVKNGYNKVILEYMVDYEEELC
jgi:hypothetical protein